MRIRAGWYANGAIHDFVCHDGRWRRSTPTRPRRLTVQAGWAAPALFDLQINGCDGRSFNSPRLTIDAIRHVVQVCRRHGIAGLCPTLVTESAEALLHGFTVLRQACESDAEIAHAIPALHLEGPYISPEDGPRAPSTTPRPSAGLGRVSPLPGCVRRPHPLGHAGARTRRRLAFIEELTASGVVAALGHTAADGCTSVTPCGPAPGCPRILATAVTPYCRVMTIPFGNSWRRMNYGQV